MNFSSRCFFRKTIEQIRLYYLSTCFCSFWKKVKTPKRHFEMHWPLVCKKVSKTFLVPDLTFWALHILLTFCRMISTLRVKFQGLILVICISLLFKYGGSCLVLHVRNDHVRNKKLVINYGCVLEYLIICFVWNVSWHQVTKFQKISWHRYSCNKIRSHFYIT